MARLDNEIPFLEMVRNTVVTYKGVAGNGVSLADVSKIARVEPITLVSSNLTGTKELYTILHGILNIYAGFYLQAVQILSAQLTDVRILKILDKTNPDRDLKTLLTSGYTAYESYNLSKNIATLSLSNSKFKLPMLVSDNNTIATEHIFDEDENSGKLGASIVKLDTFDKVGSAVGKVLQVKFSVKCTDDKVATEHSIPVVVKLDTMVIPGDVLAPILVSNKDEITLGSRFKDAIAGRIRFIKDFIFCNDLIKMQKKTMIKDNTGYYTEILRRLNNSKLYSALSGNISLAGVSSIIVISEEDEQVIQKQIGGKLTNETTRDIIFNNTSAMMIVVVDKEWERVSIYIRDISGFSQNSFAAFKNVSEKDDSAILDLVKSFSLGQAPSF